LEQTRGLAAVRAERQPPRLDAVQAPDDVALLDRDLDRPARLRRRHRRLARQGSARRQGGYLVDADALVRAALPGPRNVLGSVIAGLGNVLSGVIAGKRSVLGGDRKSTRLN